MSISTIVIGKNEEERAGKILNLINDSEFSLQNNPDLKIIEKTKTKKSIGIEEVRDLNKFLVIKPISHSQKIVIIKDANILTNEAQNSLLKILEEPPAYARIILESKSTEKLLPTIVSRCQIFYSLIEKVENKGLNFYELNLSDRFEWAEKTSKLEKDEILQILGTILLDIKNSKQKISKTSINLLLEVTENLSRFNLNTRLSLEYLALNFEIKKSKV